MTDHLETQSLLALASPARGRSIAGAVARVIDDVHLSVAALTTLTRSTGFRPKWLPDFKRDQVKFADDAERIGWALAAITLIEGLSSGQAASLKRAVAWFEDGAGAIPFGSAEADDALDRVLRREDAVAMLPYYLDTFGRTTRLDVIRDERLKGKRAERKECGSFYTPADLAHFMADAIAGEKGVQGAEPFRAVWYDPACGSGVFLLAALRIAMDSGVADPVEFASGHLLGTDIAPQACDFTAFVLLHALVPYLATAPADVWMRLRGNIAACDALPLALDRRGGRAALESLFPAAAGPLRLICNPPYAIAKGEGARVDSASTKSLYLPFVEMCWRFAGGQDDASSIVVPLALATNTGADHRRCRTALSRAGGAWTLLFFDRQPHALFGEEAKTRATVAIRRPYAAPAQIRTSGLLKWTSRQRSEIFSEHRAVAIGSVPISRLVPKVGSVDEAELYQRLVEYRLRRPERPSIEKATPDEIVGTALSNDVFVGSTAYNFLNIFRNYPDNLSWRGELSTSGIHKLRFVNAEAAHVATALMSSRIAFWLWHVECDGFHVPTWFLVDLPLLDLNFSAAERARLASLGAAAWEGLQRDILVSNNRNRLTFAFRPSEIERARREIDSIVLAHVGAGASAAESLSQFEFRVVSIDGSRRAARSSPSAQVQEKV